MSLLVFVLTLVLLGRVLDDGRVVSPVDTGSGVIGALRLRAADGRVTTLTVPPAEDGGQFSFFEDDGNYGGFADAPARGWAVFDGGLHEYVGAGGPAVARRGCRLARRR